jgi:HPt (histidine-containing phosphotransfer) domain-containing protein
MGGVSDGDILDPGVLAELREYALPDAPDPARDVTDVFLRVTPERLAHLQSAAAEGNTSEVRRIAHQVRGSCGAVGAIGMYRLASEIESADSAAEGAPLVKQLHGLFERTRSLLQASTSDTA